MTMKNGFSTINRLLGKHRESSGNLSKSSTNLSVTKSTVNINESSQVHQNRITPLPIATSNAPFEQTFRITVLLPRDQLYVARLGAKVLLQKLLQLVCENKQLDPDKYEFQHPADPSQVFSCDLTIGAVGLSEIRLCNKSEYNNSMRAPDDVTYRRNSFSSSKFSIMNSKNISNTPSLYSSRNSLNSMSSSGIDSNFRNNNNITPEVGATKYIAPVIPARKKRLAPRPPSQNLSLVENDAASQTKRSELQSNTADSQQRVTLNNEEPNRDQMLEERISDRNDLNKSNLSIDCNGNTKGSNGHCIAQCQQTSSVGAVVRRSHEVVSKETARSHSTIEIVSTLNQPEPSPRRKVQPAPRKPVPVPPPRSITKSPTENINEAQFEEKVSRDLTTMGTLQGSSPVSFPRSASSGNLISQPIENVLEIIVNKTPTIESSLLSQTPDGRTTPVESLNSQSKVSVLDDPEEQTHQSWNSSSTQSSETKHKSFIESSSEDDEMIKVYDLKLGKTIVKTLSNHKTSEVIDGVMPNVETDQTTSTPEEDFVKSPKLAEYSSEKDFSHDVFVTGEIRKDDIPDISSSILEHEPVVSPPESPEPHVPRSKDKKQDNSTIEDKLNQEVGEQRITKELNIKPENHLEFKQFVAEKEITEEATKEVIAIDIINSENPPQKPPLKQRQKETISSEIKQLIEDPDEKQKPALKQPQKDTTSSEIQQLIEDPDEKQKHPLKQTQEDTTSSEIKQLIENPDEKQKPALKQPQKDTTSSEIKQLTEDPDEKQKPALKQPQKVTTSAEIKQLIEDPDEKQESRLTNVTKSNSTQETFKQEPLISTLERLVGDEELLDVDEQQNFKSSTIQTKPAIQAKPAIQTKPALATRSSSFLSLVQLESNNQRNYTTTDEYFSSRRRSSSELSIGESPSLQSFGVIKSILNSRQNSTEESNNNNRSPSTVCDIQSMEEPSPKSNNILKTNTLKQGEKEKVYRYSGPPNIHFSTWSDRPKVQVLIKNEQDCFFNGSKSGSVQNTTNTVNKCDLALLRNKSIPVLGDLRKGSTEKGPLRETTSSYLREKETVKPQNPSPTSTRPKFIVGARTSMQWPITSATSNTLAHNNRPLSQPLIRSTSITRITSNPVIEQQTQPAFGQGTLRKTGFKEKIVPLQNNDNVFDVTKPIPFTLKNQIQNQTNPQTTPKITKNSLRTVTPVPMVPEAPPPPPIIRAVVTKQNINNNNNRTQISLTVDPRDQLLSAIRNFKREELKNGNI